MNGLSDETCEYIKGEVAALLRELSITHLPVNGIEIAQKMGMVLIPYSILNEEQYQAVMKLSEDACYLSDEYGREYIYYNSQKPSARLNWSILHEIGHAVLGHCGMDMDERTKEAEANLFAKYAIVPPILVHLLQLHTVAEIQKYFLVSCEAANYCLEYYNKWKRHITNGYQDYDIILMKQFAQCI